MFTLIDSYNMSAQDIENMIIWERDIYITLLNSKIEKEKMEAQERTNLKQTAEFYR